MWLWCTGPPTLAAPRAPTAASATPHPTPPSCPPPDPTPHTSLPPPPAPADASGAPVPGKYDLVTNVVQEGKAGEGVYREYIHRKVGAALLSFLLLSGYSFRF